MSQYKSAALEASAVCTTGEANLSYIFISNYGPAQDIMIFDAAAVPVNGAVTPVFTIMMAAAESRSIDTGSWRFRNGIAICNSTTASNPFSKTLGAADCFFLAKWG